MAARSSVYSSTLQRHNEKESRYLQELQPLHLSDDHVNIYRRM